MNGQHLHIQGAADSIGARNCIWDVVQLKIEENSRACISNGACTIPGTFRCVKLETDLEKGNLAPNCSTRPSASFFVATSSATMILSVVIPSKVEKSRCVTLTGNTGFLDFARHDNMQASSLPRKSIFP